MSDSSVPTSPGTSVGGQKALAPREKPAIVSPAGSGPLFADPSLYVSSAPPAVPTPAPSSGPAQTVTPLFWLLGFLAVFIVDALLVVVLLALHLDLAVALGVPGALTAVALGVLSAVARHIGGRG